MAKICEKHTDSTRYRGRCLQCGREKAMEWNKKHRDLCLSRNKEYQKVKKEKISMRKKAKYISDPKKYSIQARKTMLKIKYGLSIEQYETLLNEQGGVCAICKRKETVVSNKKGGIDSLRVDHCHNSLQVRGLLCQNCNFGLGHFKDNIVFLKSAINYLDKHPY